MKKLSFNQWLLSRPITDIECERFREKFLKNMSSTHFINPSSESILNKSSFASTMVYTIRAFWWTSLSSATIDNTMVPTGVLSITSVLYLSLRKYGELSFVSDITTFTATLDSSVHVVNISITTCLLPYSEVIKIEVSSNARTVYYTLLLVWKYFIIYVSII